SADKEERHFAQPGITVPGEKRFAIFPERNVGVHAGTVVAMDRLGHERDAFVVLLRHVAEDVFVILEVVGHLFHRREPDIDLRLAGCRDLVMLPLNWDAGFLELEAHLVANVLQTVGWTNREVALFRTNLVTEIRKFLAGAVPMAFRAVDEMEGRIARVAVTD